MVDVSGWLRRVGVKELFKASNMEKITGDRLAPRLTCGINETKTCILAYRDSPGPGVLMNHSAEVSNNMLRTTLITNVYDINTATILTRMVPAPTVTCLMERRNFSTKMVVSTSRGPFRRGKVGCFNKGKCGLASRARREVRTVVLSGTRRVDDPARRGVNVILQNRKLYRGCVRFTGDAMSISFGNVGVTVSYTGNTSDMATRGALGKLKTRICMVGGVPSNIGVGSGYNSARVRGLYKFIGRGGISLKLTFSNSTSEILTISRGNRVISNSGVVAVYTLRVHGRNGLGTSAIITAIVDGLKLFIVNRRRKLGVTGAGINSECILRRVLGGSCSLNNRRSKRVVFLRRGAANSKLIAKLRLITVLGGANEGLSSLTKTVRACPRILVGTGIGARGGGGCARSGRVYSLVDRVRRRFGNYKEILVEPSNARPLIHIVVRNGSRALVARETGALSSLVIGGLKWGCGDNYFGRPLFYRVVSGLFCFGASAL